LARQEINPATLRPALAGEVGAWELFPGTHVVGIRDLDRYIQVPSEKLDALLNALVRMDGQHSLTEISDGLRAAGWSMDVESLYGKVSAAGLVAGVPFLGEMKRLAIKLAELKIDWIFRSAKWIVRAYPLWVALPVLAPLGALIAIFFFGARLPRFSWQSIFWRPVGGLEWTVVIAGIVASILFHEGAHAFVAVRHGLTPSRVRVLAYLGVIPYLVLSIPGLYTVPPRTRIKVWAAGPLGSWTAACTALIALGFARDTGFYHQWFVTLAQVNLVIAIWNLFPLLPTDGYFILCTLLHTHNLRLHGWRALMDIFRGRRRPGAAIAIYGIAMVAVLAFVWQRNVFRILHFFSYSAVGYALVVGVTLLLIGRQIALATGWKSTLGVARRKKS
jgi:putative peptide zinc metalloprotease protein